MDILQISENNIDKLSSYVLNKDISEYLKFYELEDNSKYFEMLKNYISNQNSISLLVTKNNVVCGFLIGKVILDKTLEANVATVEHTLYDELSCYELMLNEFQQIAKGKNCEYMSVCAPEFQKDALSILDSTGFKKYKVELEKQLI